MNNRAVTFGFPDQCYNRCGQLRKVGFELEFTGLSIADVGRTLRTVLGGTLREESVAESALSVDDLGEFRIELDWKYIKNKALEAEQKAPNQWLDLLSQSAALVVPIEIVCPPLPLDRLAVLAPMVSALREVGASGTEDSIIAAFGVHINAEAPRLDAPCLSSYLRAFSLLQWWLVDGYDINWTRKLSPYVDLYPEAYLNQLFSVENPTMEQLVNDYLVHNASRNRALDMLPLLAEIDADRINSVVDDDRVQARPAFHYRLPDCHIEKSDWSLADAWDSWLVVERLAGQKDMLDQLAATFLEMSRPLLGVSRSDWTEVMDQWHRDHL